MKQKKNNRSTAGKISRDLTIKNEKIDHTPHDQMQEQLTDYDNNITECVEKHKKEFIGNFYVVVLTKKERLMDNVLRHYFLARKSCPTPEYDQAVYLYDRSVEDIKLLWVLPAKDICTYLISNALTIPKEQYELRDYVIDFLEGNLLKECKKFNGEQPSSPFLAEG